MHIILPHKGYVQVHMYAYVVEEKVQHLQKGCGSLSFYVVLKLHVSMRTNKKRDPPCYILHLK